MNGQQDPNAPWMHADERCFVQEFLESYQSIVLGGSGSFHYEIFYDYYQQAIEGGQCPDELVPFFRDFRARHPSAIGADERLLQNFDRTFTQLIASLLRKEPQHAHLAKPYHPNYERFLLLAEKLGESNRVHFHSLNHDLWLERLASSDSIRNEMDDGFEEPGSPYYGELDANRECYTVRLPRFIDKFDSRFRLYKLHGGIDRYWFRGDDVPSLVKLKWGMSQIHLYKEVQVNGVCQYLEGRGTIYPDFLTGTTHKTDRYERGTYYPVILRHFETNLSQSQALIVIGYGFKDSRINDYIETHFLSCPHKPVFVVGNKEQPTWQHFESKRVHFLGGGVSAMDIDFILKNMPRSTTAGEAVCDTK